MDVNLKIKYQIGAYNAVWETGHDVIGNRCFPFNVIMYVHSGSYCLFIQGKWHRYIAGEAFIVTPFIRHSVKIDEPSVISWIHISFQYSNGLDFLSFCRVPDVFTNENTFLIKDACNRIVESSKDDIISSIELQEHSYSLLASLLSVGAITYAPELNCGFMYDVYDYIYKLIDSPISVNALAEHFNFSVSFFRKKFKKHFNMSPQQFIQKRKLEKACEYLLNEDISIADVAKRVGYVDQLYFSRVFAKVYMLSPKQYRDNYNKHYLCQ